MLATAQIVLNQGQEDAVDGFFQFLLNDEKEMILSGPGGVGKTFLMGQLVDRVMPQYKTTCALMGIKPEYDTVVMTATTNKAAEVLSIAINRPTETIHSFLNLKVQEDYSNGRTKLIRTRNWEVHTRKVIFIDECSMIDSQLYKMIQEGTHLCKIVYVGDHSQLAPVTETLSPIYRQGLTFFGLTQPMRNANQKALMDACAQIRKTVETGQFKPIQIVPGVIDWVDDHEMETMIAQSFAHQTRDSRILAYTNKRVVEYNEHIRSIRNLPHEYGPGELLVNNQAIHLDGKTLSVEDEVEIIDQSATTIDHSIAPGVTLTARTSTLKTRLGETFYNISVPVDREHYASLVRYFSRQKRWPEYFHLKSTFPDLRPRDAATVHKAQGSTYETVFLDVGNLSTCHLPNVVARLLYVGFTRASQRVILYGNLAEKYGGLII
jgi:hypothetical protein